LGGNLRYFEPGFNLMTMLDYDLQFKALNIITAQGTLMGGSNGTGTDFNFLLDRRRSPILDIRNATNGVPTTVGALLQSGDYNMTGLIDLANQRTTTTTMAQLGMTNHLTEQWLAGTDFTVVKTASLGASGFRLIDPITGAVISTGMAGYIDPIPSSRAWTISERLTGMSIFQPRDVTNFSLSYTKAEMSKSSSFQVSNHVDLRDKWVLDTSLRLSDQRTTTGGKSDDLAPTARVAYRMRNNLTLDAQLGVDWSWSSSSVVDTSATSSRATREFFSLGCRLDF